ncbi:DUF1573 domain-containing protein [Flavilitoribacter nigricans]|uniref:DUF1573 domain-containing protein n=1 Tax=Flavilitoribacter nigricans (strain ATCC 23147 / DSM 23189 / NBRC 102662 / NCIMB 1420 / SS-2) TaxID=1122177 RepID=A0A2D0N318_FLAN2|nr:DUF1573 domain-containing protein [Flavilitoribacter nigricans]PHN02847.1 hypothetical protein CRP01_30165 [Flavilitoribacter nigricans DSM 23189 = NBRC 102662]
MKIIFYLFIPFLFLSGSEDRVVDWLSPTEHDFGDIVFKEPVHHTFRFKNVSDAPIVIDNIRPSCGCTAVDWEETVIEPDSTGLINASYDAHLKGYFRKSMKVYFHGQRKAEKLWLEGYVIE